MNDAMAAMRLDFELGVQKMVAQADAINRAMNGIGVGATDTVAKFDRSTARMISRIQEQTIAMQAGGRASAAYFEQMGKAKGQEKALEPYIAKLRELEAQQQRTNSSLASNDAAFAKTGMSAGQMAFAMRTLPMQFTDIWTSIASGQRPMTVLIQQGGQLKDLFGGIGPAAKAMGGYLASMIKPITLIVAAIGTLAVAWKFGSDEMRDFQKEAILTGNSIALSASKYTQVRDAIAGIGATQGKASEVMAEIAKSGEIAAGSMTMVAQTAILMEKVAGQKISETVKDFSALAEDPVKASEKLNKQYTYLTAAVYEQIKALDDQGKRMQAAELAEKSYADAMKGRAQQVVENTGLMERGWRNLLGIVKSVWDAMLNIGRADSLSEQLAKAQTDLVKAQSSANPFIREKETEAARQRIANLQEQVRMEKRLQEATEQRQRVEKEGIAAVEAVAKANERGLSKQQQMNKALDEYRRNIERVRAANPSSALLDPAKIAAAEKAIREQFAAAKSKPLIDQAAVDAAKQYVDALQDLSKIAAGAAAKTEDLSKSQARLREIMLSPAWQRFNRQQQEQVIMAAAVAQASEDEAEAVKRMRQENTEAIRTYADLIETKQKDVDALQRQVEAERLATQAIGQSKTAVAELEAAKLRDAAASKERDAAIADSIDLSGKMSEKLREEAKLLRELADEKMVRAQKEANHEAANAASREWERVADSFVDNLMRGGKSVAQYLKDLFRTLVLRPLLQPIGNAIAGVGASLFGGQASAGTNAVGGMQGLFGDMAQGATVLSGIGSMFGAGGLSGSLMAGAGWLTGSTTLGGALSAGASLIGTGTAAGAMSGVGMIVGALGPIALGIAAVVALLKDKGGPKVDARSGYLASNIGLNGGIDSGLQAQAVQSAQAMQTAFDNLTKSVGLANTGIQFGLGISTDPKGDSPTFLDITASRSGQIVSSSLNRNVGRNPEDIANAISAGTSTAVLGALKAIGDELPETLRKMLADVDVSGLASDAAQKMLGDIDKIVSDVNSFNAAMKALPFENLRDLSFDAAHALIEANGGLQQFTANLASYYENFYSEEEKRINVAKQLSSALGGAGMQKSADDLLALAATGDDAKAVFRSWVESTEQGSPLWNALIGINGAFASLIQPVAELSPQVDALSDALKSLKAEQRSLEVQLLQAKGLTDQATALQRSIDIEGLTAAEVAQYDYNQSLRDQIQAVNDAKKASEDYAEAQKKAAAEAAEAQKASLQSWYDNFTTEEQKRRDKATELNRQITSTFGDGAGATFSVEKILGMTREDVSALMTQFSGNSQVTQFLLDWQQTIAEVVPWGSDIIETTEDVETLAEALARLRNPMRTVQDIAQSIISLEAQGQALKVQLLQVQGNTAGAGALQRTIDTAGMTADEVAIYDANEAIRAQIKAEQELQAHAQQVASTQEQLTKQLLQVQGDTAALRQMELDALAALDPALVELQKQIYAAQDAADAAAIAERKKAEEDAKRAQVQAERESLQKQIWQLEGNTAALRKAELAELAPANRALQERIYKLQDEAAAAAKAAAIASEREGLQKQLYALEGNTAAIRALELAKLDPSNRALQERIWALQDEKEAADKATAAAKQTRDAWKALSESLIEEAARTRAMLVPQSRQGLSELQAQFAVANAMARAGDQKAAGSLTGLNQSILNVGQSQLSGADYRRLVASQAFALEQTGLMVGNQFGSENVVVTQLQTTTETLSADLHDTNEALDNLGKKFDDLLKKLSNVEKNTKDALDIGVKVLPGSRAIETTAS